MSIIYYGKVCVQLYSLFIFSSDQTIPKCAMLTIVTYFKILFQQAQPVFALKEKVENVLVLNPTT